MAYRGATNAHLMKCMNLRVSSAVTSRAVMSRAVTSRAVMSRAVMSRAVMLQAKIDPLTLIARFEG